MAKELVIIAHNIRSAHNVGSLLRTAEGLGVKNVYLTGYTPYPLSGNDSRLPHLAKKIQVAISKTALGAEGTQAWEQADDVFSVIKNLKDLGYTIAGLEQHPGSIKLPEFVSPEKLAILLGSEVTGIDKDLMDCLDICLEIPMFGKKESFNVVQAAAMALYHCTFK